MKGGEMKYQKPCQLVFKPAGSFEPGKLEMSAHGCVDEMFLSILRDEASQTVLLEGSARRVGGPAP